MLALCGKAESLSLDDFAGVSVREVVTGGSALLRPVLPLSGSPRVLP